MAQYQNIVGVQALEQALKVTFLDSGREPKCQAHPDFPNGVDVDISQGAAKTCIAEIPHPAPRCGVMVVKCDSCGLSVGLTVVGRVDDPKSVKMACKLN